MELFVTGLSHRTAPVAVRERLAIVPAELEAHVRRLAAAAGMREAVVVSTCNRTEIYGAFSDADQAQRSVREVLMEALVAGGPLPEAEDPEMVCARHLYTRERREAVPHLFRVAASLDSLVVGEPQILGQIKEAYDLALRAGAAGPLLGSVFSQAFRVARKVRRDTGIALAKVSVSSVAVDLARQVWGGFKGRRVLIVGRGQDGRSRLPGAGARGRDAGHRQPHPGQGRRAGRTAGRGGAALGEAGRGAGAGGHRVHLDRRPGVRAHPRHWFTTPAGPGTERRSC